MKHPFYFQWHITEKCNLRCKHCYQNSSDYQDHTSSENFNLVLDRIATALKKWKLDGRVALTGGEPFVVKNYQELVHNLNQQPWLEFFDILSNGTLIDDDTALWCSKLSRLRRIQISLDGANSERHDKIRGNGAFKATLEGIESLRKYGVKISFMFTLFRSNLDQLEEILEFAHCHGAESISIERLVPIGRGEHLKNEVLTPDEIKIAYLKIWELSKEFHKMGRTLRILKFRTLWAAIDTVHTHTQQNLTGTLQLGASCSIGLDALCIMPDLTVFPCRRLPLPIGNLKEDNLFKIWYTSPLLWKIRNKHLLKGKCHECNIKALCGGCRAVAYAETGDYLEEDPQCFYEVKNQ